MFAGARSTAAVAPRDIHVYMQMQDALLGENVIEQGFSPGFYCAKQSSYAGENLHNTSHCCWRALSCHAEK